MGLAFASLDTSIRWIGPALPMLFILAWRYGVQAFVMAVWLRTTRRRFRPEQPRFQALRSVLLLVTSAFSFSALQHMPVAEFTAIVMLSPVLVTLLAAAVLNERVGALRWALVALAFVGALIVIRPGSGLFGWAVWLAIGAALVNAGFQVLTRRMGALDDPYVTHFWTGAVACALLWPLALGVDAGATWSSLAALTARQWMVLVALGLFGTAGHLLLILALRQAPASVLMPFTYSQVASATFIAWLVFGRWPDGPAWAGMTLIVASGAATAALNLLRHGARPPSAVDSSTPPN